MRRLVAVLLVLLLALAGGVTPAEAQQNPTTTTVAELPPADIIPRPDSGSAPQDAGDRGGALQLGVLALVLLALVGGVANGVRQSRQARTDPEA